MILKKFNEISSIVSSFDSKLLVVCKNQPVQNIIPLLNTGHLFFAENRVQEAYLKWPGLLDMFPNANLALIGHLQKNKVKKALLLFNEIYSVDSIALLKRIIEYSAKLNIPLPKLWLQVNISSEEQKYGFNVNQLDDTFHFAREHNISFQGIMIIPSKFIDFKMQMLQALEIKKLYNLPFISAGMSNDFLLALQLGSDNVRVGSSIFS